MKFLLAFLSLVLLTSCVNYNNFKYHYIIDRNANLCYMTPVFGTVEWNTITNVPCNEYVMKHLEN